jgi:hypothetical protein
MTVFSISTILNKNNFLLRLTDTQYQQLDKLSYQRKTLMKKKNFEKNYDNIIVFCAYYSKVKLVKHVLNNSLRKT